MNFFSDLLLATGAIGAAVFCLVLSRRLKALASLDSGMGSAIAVLSAQVDDLTRALKAAQETSRNAYEKLESQTRRAEGACRQLELLMASMHDLPESPAPRVAEEAAHVRPLTSWNTAAVRRPAEVADAPLQRARVLRRRQSAGGV